MKSHIAILGAILVPFSSSASGADRVAVYFAGYVSSIDDPVGVFSGISVGDPVYGNYYYGVPLPDTNPDPGTGTYTQSPPDAGLFITVGSNHFWPEYWDPLRINVSDNDPVAHDWFWLSTGVSTQWMPCTGRGTLLDFRDLSGTAITSDALFLLAPALSDFPLAYGIVAGSGCDPSGEPVTLWFNVTFVATLATPIPTMSSWALAITALSLMACGTIVLRHRRIAS